MSFGIFFEITDLCNHECVHCCKTWREDNNHTMNKEVLDKIISYPKDYITISGGEPALARDEVMYVCEREIKRIQMNTNLTLWNEEDLRYLDQRVAFKISVPSMIKLEYEKIVKANTYNQLIKNLKIISKSHQITVIVNNYTINTVQQTIEYLAYMGFYNFTIQPQIPTKFASVDVEKALMNIEQLYLNKRNLNIKLLCKSNDSIVPINHICNAGVGRFVILSNGDVVPCACYEAPKLGNIMTTSYEELRAKGITYFNNCEDKITCRGFQDVRKKCT